MIRQRALMREPRGGFGLHWVIGIQQSAAPPMRWCNLQKVHTPGKSLFCTNIDRRMNEYAKKTEAMKDHSNTTEIYQHFSLHVCFTEWISWDKCWPQILSILPLRVLISCREAATSLKFKESVTSPHSLCYTNCDRHTGQTQTDQQHTQEEEVGAGSSEWTCCWTAVFYQWHLADKER